MLFATFPLCHIILCHHCRAQTAVLSEMMLISPHSYYSLSERTEFISNTKHLPGSLAAQIKVTCQKHVSRGNMLSTSYKDTLQSMQVHNVNFYNHFLLLLIKVGLSLQKGDKTVTQMLRNNKLSLFGKGTEEQKQRYTSVRIKNERENRKI